MRYINFIIILFLLSSCATTDNGTTTSSGYEPSIQSPDEIIRYKKGLVFLNNNELEEARNIFLDFNKTRPELAGPYANLAVIKIKENDYDSAFELVNLSLRKNPQLPQALNLLAFLEEKKGNIKSAEINYLKAIEHKEDYALAHYNLALLYDIYMQDINKAILHYERYMQLTGYKDKKTADWLEQIKSQNKG